jgi:hypothetical protein
VWANKAGNFQINTFSALPNSLVGINPNLGRQAITLTFIVSPENGQQYIGTTTFDIFKVSDTEFKHSRPRKDAKTARVQENGNV